MCFPILNPFLMYICNLLNLSSFSRDVAAKNSASAGRNAFTDLILYEPIWPALHPPSPPCVWINHFRFKKNAWRFFVIIQSQSPIRKNPLWFLPCALTYLSACEPAPLVRGNIIDTIFICRPWHNFYIDKNKHFMAIFCHYTKIVIGPTI